MAEPPRAPPAGLSGIDRDGARRRSKLLRALLLLATLAAVAWIAFHLR